MLVLILTDVCIAGKPEYEIMQTAWRERNPGARIKAAKDAIGLNPECATAYILLAEEEVTKFPPKKSQNSFKKSIFCRRTTSRKPR